MNKFNIRNKRFIEKPNPHLNIIDLLFHDVSISRCFDILFNLTCTDIYTYIEYTNRILRTDTRLCSLAFVVWLVASCSYSLVVYVYVCIYVCVCVCMCMYIYIDNITFYYLFLLSYFYYSSFFARSHRIHPFPQILFPSTIVANWLVKSETSPI